MTRSIRLHWVGRLFKGRKQQIDSGLELLYGGNRAAQMANPSLGNLLIGNGVASQNISDQFNLQNGAGVNACSNNAIEVNKGSAVGSYNFSGLGGQSAGMCGLSHNGSFKYFKWDTAQGCMVEVVVSTPFLARLARSLDAFLQSWRLG